MRDRREQQVPAELSSSLLYCFFSPCTSPLGRLTWLGGLKLSCASLCSYKTQLTLVSACSSFKAFQHKFDFPIFSMFVNTTFNIVTLKLNLQTDKPADSGSAAFKDLPDATRRAQTLIGFSCSLGFLLMQCRVSRMAAALLT